MLYLDAQAVRPYFSVVRKQTATEKYLYRNIPGGQKQRRRALRQSPAACG